MPRPERIASLVPSWTETVLTFGAGSRLIGRTRYCVEPAEQVAVVPEFGGTKNPNREAIAAATPDLVIVNREENRLEDIAWFEQRFACFEATPRTVAEVPAQLRALGRLLSTEAMAEQAAASVEAELAVEPRADGPVVFYVVWPKPWMATNDQTYIHDVLRCCGVVNSTAAHSERYPTLAESELSALGVDLVLLPDEPYPFTAAAAETVRGAGTFGGADVRFVCGRDFCWHGVHSAAGLRAAREVLAW